MKNILRLACTMLMSLMMMLAITPGDALAAVPGSYQSCNSQGLAYGMIANANPWGAQIKMNNFGYATRAKNVTINAYDSNGNFAWTVHSQGGVPTYLTGIDYNRDNQGLPRGWRVAANFHWDLTWAADKHCTAYTWVN